MATPETERGLARRIQLIIMGGLPFHQGYIWGEQISWFCWGWGWGLGILNEFSVYLLLGQTPIIIEWSLWGEGGLWGVKGVEVGIHPYTLLVFIQACFLLPLIMPLPILLASWAVFYERWRSQTSPSTPPAKTFQRLSYKSSSFLGNLFSST